MKILLGLFIFLLLSNDQYAQQDTVARRVQLPNGWSLTPVGRSVALGDLPLNVIVSPSKKYIAVTNNGQSTQSIQVIDVVKDKILSETIIPKSWLGLAFSSDEKFLYASGGNDNLIVKYQITDGKSLLNRIR